MSKAGKVIGGLVLAAVAVVAVVLVLVFQNLDGIIKRVIEDVGSKVTNTSVTVDSVKFSLTEGRGEIYGLAIGNPSGYSRGKAFEISEVALQVAPASLTGPVIVIKEVLVDGAKLNIEQKGTGNNLSALLEGMNTGTSEPEAAPADTAPSDTRLMLEQFSFTNSAAKISTEQHGEHSLKLPAIKVSNIGDKQNGLTPEQLASQLVASVVKQAEKAVSKYLGDLVKDAAKKEANKRIDEKVGSENREKLEGLFKKK